MSSKYLDIYRRLDSYIRSMPAGERIPSEKKLSQQFRVSPMTVRRALTMLIDEGRLQGIPGKGTFICRQSPIKKNAAIPSFSDTITQAGKTPSSKLLLAALALASPSDQVSFDLDDDSHIYILRRLRLADDVPICLEESHINPAVIPDLLTKDLTGSLYRIFAEDYHVPVSSSTYTIRARLADNNEAQMLELNDPGVCLEVKNLTYSADGTLLESAVSLYRGDMYEFSI